jgi:hypothetical protein
VLFREEPGKHLATASREYTAATRDVVRRSTTTAKSSSGSVYYKNCDAAQAAGAAPLHRGDPGFRDALDGDNDGVACDVN